MIYLPGQGRVVVAGGPRTGKTTLARQKLASGFRVRHADELIATHEWSAASAHVATWLDEPGPWVVEGVTAVRGLRKWLAAHPEGKPCDVVAWLDRPQVARSPGQETMARGTLTIWSGVWPELVRRGVEIQLQE